jgi:hypothetical protein
MANSKFDKALDAIGRDMDNEQAWAGHDGKLRHAGGVFCQDPEAA